MATHGEQMAQGAVYVENGASDLRQGAGEDMIGICRQEHKFS